MKIMLNFKCSCGLILHDQRVESDTKAITCECGKVANKMLSAPRCFGNTTGGSPSTRY
jgi:hypothetical protein